MLRRNNESFFSNLKIFRCRSSCINSSFDSLCDFLECLTRLEALDIGENYLSEDYLFSLLTRISKLVYLREIMLDSVLLESSPPGYCGSVSYFRFPSSVQRLCISYNNFSTAGLDLFMRCASGIQVISLGVSP